MLTTAIIWTVLCQGVEVAVIYIRFLYIHFIHSLDLFLTNTLCSHDKNLQIILFKNGMLGSAQSQLVTIITC